MIRCRVCGATGRLRRQLCTKHYDHARYLGILDRFPSSRHGWSQTPAYKAGWTAGYRAGRKRKDH